MILLVLLQMLCQVVNSAGQERNLHCRGTGVPRFGGELVDDLLLVLLVLSGICSSAQDTITKDGFQKFYYQNGVLSSEGTMRSGKPDGYWKSYYENGKLKSEGNRKNFELDSLWRV